VHASQAQHSEFAEDAVVGELTSAPSLHLMPSGEEVSDAVIDMMIDRPIGLQPSAIAEVRRPSAQKCVESIAYAGPGPVVARYQEFSDLVLDSLYTLLGWARVQVPVAILMAVMRAE
jgi:hypothetical protein